MRRKSLDQVEKKKRGGSGVSGDVAAGEGSGGRDRPGRRAGAAGKVKAGVGGAARSQQRSGDRDPGGSRRGGDGGRGAGGARAAGEARVLRIIGGSWRGRKLRFPPSPGIRPTPDRVRETLFNWLAPRIVGSRCLDLFAGSGALGLESLSRGAAHVTFVERDGAAARELQARLAEFGAKGGAVEHGDAVRFLASRATAAAAGGGNTFSGTPSDGGGYPGGTPGGGASKSLFDIVFLDPPFDSDLLATTATLLEQNQWLASGALIYAECPARGGLPPLPPTWTATKAKQAGEVGYHLLKRA